MPAGNMYFSCRINVRNSFMGVSPWLHGSFTAPDAISAIEFLPACRGCAHGNARGRVYLFAFDVRSEPSFFLDVI
jgi:hypothetical protein